MPGPRLAGRTLFVCAGNTCRSPMAEALARQLLGNGAQVESAGISALAGAPAAPHAVTVMRERNLDISAHRARPVASLTLAEFDAIVALAPAIERPLRRIGPGSGQLCIIDIDDPYGKDVAAYRRTADALHAALIALVDQGRLRHHEA